MAFVTCPECRNSVSERAPMCPNCGHPINSPPPNWSGRTTHVQVTGVEFTRKWIKILNMGVLALLFGGGIISNQNQLLGNTLCVAGIFLMPIAGIIHWWYHA